jgi:CheY-like chemotaxis protein
VTCSLRFVFAGPRYEITSVESGGDALALFDSDQDRFDVVIVDQKMPHLTGLELVERFKQRGVSAQVIVISAYLSSEVQASYQRMGVEVMFGKPFDIAELRFAVDRLVG